MSGLAEEALETWRRKGPVANFHDLITHSQGTPKRRRFFEVSRNADAETDDDRMHRMVVNGDIR